MTTTDFVSDSDFSVSRNKLICQYLEMFKPKRVVDIGCNMGLFSLLAASRKAEVWGFDVDEASNEQFYNYVKNCDKAYNLSISLGDIAGKNINPRNVGDLVIALALSHHFFISQRYNFEVFAENVASYTSNALVTEFMPNGLGGAAGPRPSPLPEGYKLEKMLSALECHFKYVESIDYPVPGNVSPRIFIVCSGKHGR